MNAKKTSFILSILLIMGILGSCSIQKLAMNAIADALGGGTTGGSAFTSDNDPQLVGDALPFALKLYETILEQTPDNTGLLLTTGTGFIMYANAFVQSPADMLSDFEYEKQDQMYQRAKKLYLRGRNYIFDELEIKHPGFKKAVADKTLEDFLPAMTAEDVDALYWGAAGWFAAISINIFDIGLAIEMPQAKAMMDRAYELNPDFGDGTIDDFYIMVYASLPKDMGGDKDKAVEHFNRAVKLSKGLNASPYVSLATSLYIPEQNLKKFKELLNEALAIDVDKNPDTRLANILAQEKAQWYLDHIDQFFLVNPDDEEGM